MTTIVEEHPSKSSLLAATLNVVREKGYSASRLDDICAVAGVTKGSFFHHFDSKEDLALAAAELWGRRAASLCVDLSSSADPLDRLLAYIDRRKALMTDDLMPWTCFGGTVIQETYVTHPPLRDACQKGMTEHGAQVSGMIEAAIRHHSVTADWTADSLSHHIQAVIQGAIILAKGQGEATAAQDCIDHLRRYVELLFRSSQKI